MKGTPLIFIMFGVVILCAIIIAISSIYGEADWTWIAQQVVTFLSVFLVLGLTFYTLMGWVKR